MTNQVNDRPMTRGAVADASIEERLGDGTLVRFRAIGPDDKERLVSGFSSLSAESRYGRFFSVLGELSPKMLRYLTEIDFVNHYAWMAVLKDVPLEPGIGVARWIRTGNAPEAEAAITVIDSYQGRGVGRRLLELLVFSAVERGIERFTAQVLSVNAPMRHLFASLGATITHQEAGVVELVMPLPKTILDFPNSPALAVLRAVADGRLESRPVGTRDAQGPEQGPAV